MTNLVIIDLGSNSVRMKTFEVDRDGNFNVVDYQKEYVRLSENMGADKILQKTPMDRTLRALKDFKASYSQRSHVVIRAVATAAVRQAQNQAEFLAAVEKEVGLKLQVISGRTEAYLDYLGVVHTLPISNGIIVDTGGASVELVWVKNGRCAQRVSLPLGSVLLSQTYHLEDQIQASDLFSAMTRFEKELAGVSWLRQVHNLPLIALGGSNRTIAKVYRRQVTDDADDMPDIHDLHLPASYVADLFSRLLHLDQADRMQIPGLAKNRADVIIGGLIPINLLLRNLQIGEVIFSNHGLRDGLLYEFLAAQKKS